MQDCRKKLYIPSLIILFLALVAVSLSVFANINPHASEVWQKSYGKIALTVDCSSASTTGGIQVYIAEDKAYYTLQDAVRTEISIPLDDRSSRQITVMMFSAGFVDQVLFSVTVTKNKVNELPAVHLEKKTADSKKFNSNFLPPAEDYICHIIENAKKNYTAS